MAVRSAPGMGARKTGVCCMRGPDIAHPDNLLQIVLAFEVNWTIEEINCPVQWSVRSAKANWHEILIAESR